MRAWPRPDVPSLPGEGDPPTVHDSSTGQPTRLDGPERAGLYVCGITPYDATHLGHAATYLAFDLLIRTWLDSGRQVTYVQNVTDVDDPLFERATATGEDWAALAERETELFRTDMAALRILPPDAYIGAGEAMSMIVDLVSRIEKLGATYELDGDVYFDVHADEVFGSVSRLSPAEMRVLSAERGGDPDRPGKRHPLDCQLWTHAKPGEPSWPSPWGPGRPGWHIECTAIALDHLGAAFDVQGGGRDLVFPHHEMSASQGRVVTGEPFARAYVHQGMVGLDGEKMSKSRGNLVLVSRLRESGVDPMAIRLALLAHHYRSDWSWTGTDLSDATERLERWRLAVRHGHGAEPEADTPGALQVLAEVRAAMADDLGAGAAMVVVDDWVAHAMVSEVPPGEAAFVGQVVDALLGVDLS